MFSSGWAEMLKIVLCQNKWHEIIGSQVRFFIQTFICRQSKSLMAFQPFLHKRMLYNASKVLSRQLSEAQQYDEIGNVYTLCFIDEVAEKGIDDWFHHYIIKHKKHPERQMHFG
jgi:hypothetical protein